MEKPVDPIDLQIIELLTKNGRMKHEDIALTVHLSRPAVHERIKRLEQQGIIKGYTLKTDLVRMGYPIHTFISVDYECSKYDFILNEIRNLDVNGIQIEEAHRISGQYCLLLKARAVTTTSLQEFLDRLLGIPDIKTYKNHLILSTFIEET
jgi:Lrp/AsnC family leucine-responsive transcriptional regulator